MIVGPDYEAFTCGLTLCPDRTPNLYVDVDHNGPTHDCCLSGAQGVIAGAIHKDLMDTLGPDAVAYISGARYLRGACCLRSDQETPSVED
jgi:hypothetical protein